MFDGAGWRGRDGFEDFESKAEKGKDVSRRIVAAVGVAILAENDVLVSMHDLDAPMAAIDAKKRFGRRLAGRRSGDQIDDFLLGLLPSAVLLALPKARDAANVFYAGPVPLDAGGLGGKHVDRTPFDAPMRLLVVAVIRDQGEKPARRKPLQYSPASFSDCP